jgi:chemotaxis protein CheX
MIDASYINAFVEAIENVFATMLQSDVQVREPMLKRASETEHDVSAIIGLSGDVMGSVVLSFPTEVAERVAGLFTGMPMTCEHEDFADAIGELVNMISGNAKAKFEGRRSTISVPTVVLGKKHTVMGQRDLPMIVLPCSCDCGDFVLEVILKDLTAPEQAHDTAQAQTCP